MEKHQQSLHPPFNRTQTAQDPELTSWEDDCSSSSRAATRSKATLSLSRTFSSSALWCSNRDLSALRTSTSLETPAGDWACLFTTVILRLRSWRDTRHSRCSSSSWKHSRHIKTLHSGLFREVHVTRVHFTLGKDAGQNDNSQKNRHINSLTRVLFLSALSSAISSSLSSSCSRQRFSSLVSTANSCRVTRGRCYWLSAVTVVWYHVCSLTMLDTHLHPSHCEGHRIHTLFCSEALGVCFPTFLEPTTPSFDIRLWFVRI